MNRTLTNQTPPGFSADGEGVLVITPTFDEAPNIQNLVESVFSELPRARMLVVDDASPDGTAQVARRLGPRVHVLERERKLGLGSAYRHGFAWALERDYGAIIQMDADLSHDPAHLPAFVTALQTADVVVGSRNVAGGGVVGWGLGRHLLSKGGSIYARAVLGVPTTDLTTGFKAIRSSALKRLQLSETRSNGYAFQVEMTYRALQRGMTVIEIPIVFEDRRVGQSKMTRAIFVEAVWRVWALRWTHQAAD